MLQYEYMREALKQGLKLEEKLGANPFKYGMAAGTDTHLAIAAPEEENFFGKTAAQEPNAGWFGFSAAMTSRPRTRKAACRQRPATPRACPWAAI